MKRFFFFFFFFSIRKTVNKIIANRGEAAVSGRAGVSESGVATFDVVDSSSINRKHDSAGLELGVLNIIKKKYFFLKKCRYVDGAHEPSYWRYVNS